MKGFATNLTASRLEEMLAFYMAPERSSRDETDDFQRENGATPAKMADQSAEHAPPLAALTEN